MIQAELKDNEGKVIEVLNLPENANEIELPNYVDLLVAYEEHKDFYNKATDSLEDKLQTAIYHTNEVAAFCGSDNLFGERVIKLGQEQDIDLTLQATNQLRNFIWSAVSSYKQEYRTDKDYEFEYKGDKYYLKRTWGEKVKGNVSFESLTTGEGIECLEVMRWMEQKDPTGGIRQTGWLRLLSVLARKKDEKFPTTKSKIRKFLDERAKHFEQIPFPIAMDCLFWFVSYHESLKKKVI